MDYRLVKRPDYSAIGDYLAKYRRSVKDVGYIHRKEKMNLSATKTHPGLFH